MDKADECQPQPAQTQLPELSLREWTQQIYLMSKIPEKVKPPYRFTPYLQLSEIKTAVMWRFVLLM